MRRRPNADVALHRLRILSLAANIERLIDIIQKAERSPEESIIVIVVSLNDCMLQNASNASLEI